MSQRFVAKQSQFTPELNEFRLKIQDAKRENNMALGIILLLLIKII